MMRCVALLALMFVAGSAMAIDVYEPRLSPDVVVVADYMLRAPARTDAVIPRVRFRFEHEYVWHTNVTAKSPTLTVTNANGSVSYVPDYSQTNYIARIWCQTNSWQVVSHLADYFPAGASEMDETIRGAVLDGSVSVLEYARRMYGDAACRQIVRAALQRGEQYVESPYTTASAALYNPANIPMLMPGMKKAPYSATDATLPKSGLGDGIPIAGRCVAATNALDYLLWGARYTARGYTIRPEARSAAEALDDEGRSYALPTIGVALHRPSDYAHELAHFINPTHSLSNETAVSTGFSEGTLNACTSWKEFLPAYHALKVDAWSRGIDLGMPGSWTDYWAIVGQSAETIAALDGSMSADGMALLTAYREAKAAEGTPGDNADYVRIRSWCESDAIGRAVL